MVFYFVLTQKLNRTKTKPQKKNKYRLARGHFIDSSLLRELTTFTMGSTNAAPENTFSNPPEASQ